MLGYSKWKSYLTDNTGPDARFSQRSLVPAMHTQSYIWPQLSMRRTDYGNELVKYFDEATRSSNANTANHFIDKAVWQVPISMSLIQNISLISWNRSHLKDICPHPVERDSRQYKICFEKISLSKRKTFFRLENNLGGWLIDVGVRMCSFPLKVSRK